MHYDYYSFFVQDVKSAPVKTRQALVKVLRELEAAIVLADVVKVKKLEGYKKACYIKIGQYRLCFYKEKDRLLLAQLLFEEELHHLLSSPPEASSQSLTPVESPVSKVRKPTPRKIVTKPNPSPRIKKTPPAKQ